MRKRKRNTIATGPLHLHDVVSFQRCASYDTQFAVITYIGKYGITLKDIATGRKFPIAINSDTARTAEILQLHPPMQDPNLTLDTFENQYPEYFI